MAQAYVVALRGDVWADSTKTSPKSILATEQEAFHYVLGVRLGRIDGGGLSDAGSNEGQLGMGEFPSKTVLFAESSEPPPSCTFGNFTHVQINICGNNQHVW